MTIEVPEVMVWIILGLIFTNIILLSAEVYFIHKLWKLKK